MSLKYRDKNGAEVVLAGLTPGGNIEAGAVATREGVYTISSAVAAGATGEAAITFSDPMPDADYEVVFNTTSTRLNVNVRNTKTANGFTLYWQNVSDAATGSVDVQWKAFKLYEVADAEQLYSKVTDIEAMVPANASSTNKFTTADDLRTETRTLDRRLDDVEDVVPTSASITNKLVTQSDLSGVEIDKVEDINDVELTNIQDGQTLIWDNTNSKWVNGQGGKVYTAGDGIDISNTDEISAKVNPAQFDFDAGGKMSLNGEYKKTFVGTKAEWDALSTSKKKEYTIANITDDVIGGEVADVVQDGLMSPVTSNAVYDFPIDNLINGEHRPPTANTVLAHIQPLLTGNYGGTVSITPNLVADLETGFQNAGDYSLFYVSSQASEEGGFIGFRHNANKNCYVIGISSAWGVCIGLRNPTSGTWTFKRIEAI